MSTFGEIFPGLAIGLLALFCGLTWWRSRRRVSDPYDLKKLYDEPPGTISEPDDDLVTEESGPYCVACDEPNKVGTVFCRSCGRKLS